MPGQRRIDRSRLDVQVFGEQAVAKVVNHTGDLRVTARLDRRVALGVHSHRTVREIGRTDAQDLVVDDHQLGVQIDAQTSAQSVDMRVVNVQTAMRVRRAQPLDQPRAQNMHRVLF